MKTIAIFGSYVLSRRDGAQEVLRDHWVLLEGRRIAAVTRDRPSATEIFDKPGRFVLPGLLNLHNHCFSEAVARTHTEDGNGRRNNQSIVYTVLLPLTKRGADLLSPSERLAIARLGILQLLKGGATTVMEPFRNTIPEMFDAADEMGIRFYGAPYLFSTSDAKAGPDGVVRYAGDDGQADHDPSCSEPCRGRDDREALRRSHAGRISRLAGSGRARSSGGALHREHRWRFEADGGERRSGAELPARVCALRCRRGVQPVCGARRQDGGRNRWLQHGPSR